MNYEQCECIVTIATFSAYHIFLLDKARLSALLESNSRCSLYRSLLWRLTRKTCRGVSCTLPLVQSRAARLSPLLRFGDKIKEAHARYDTNRVHLFAEMKILQSISMLYCACYAVTGHAQAYPNKPIRLIVPYAAGGNGDILARVDAQMLAEGLRQQVVVDNRVGANGIIGTDLCAKAPPDGYTLLYAGNGHATNPALYDKLPYDSIKDFDAISLVASSPLVLAVTNSLPVTSVKELIALAKAQPHKLTFATAGTGSSGHLSAILFNTMAGLDILHVPYRSVSQATTDLISGQIQVMFPSFTSALPHLKARRVRALAVTSAQRSALLPDMPTVAEAGVAGYQMTIWNGILAPAHLPKPIVARLNAQLQTIANDRDVKERFASIGADPDHSTPEALNAFIKLEIAKWDKLLRAAGVRID
jgi:tripartite-type tricarboxylate transporter receptor subunit TctC